MANYRKTNKKGEIAPNGYHYMSDDSLMSDEEHERLHGKPFASGKGAGNGGNCIIDIVIVVDSSNSIHININEQNMVTFIKDFIASFSTELTDDDVRIGLVHFDAGSLTYIHSYQNIPCSSNSLSGESPLYLTSDQGVLNDWADITYQLGVQPGGIHTDPPGTDIAGGVWMGLNLLYGNNSRLGVQKRLITIFDGPHYLDQSNVECGQYLGATSTITSPYQAPSLDAAAIFNPIAVNQGYSSHQLIKSIPNCPADFASGGTVLGNTSWQTGHSSDVWFQNSIINNNSFNDLKTYSALMTDSGLPVETLYAELWAHPGRMHYGSFDGSIVLPGGSTTADMVAAIRDDACDDYSCHKWPKSYHMYACPCDWRPVLINTQYSGHVVDLLVAPPVNATFDAPAGKAYSKDIWYCKNNNTGQIEVAMDYPLSQIDGAQPLVGDKFHGCGPGAECWMYDWSQIDNGGVWSGCSGYPTNITNTTNDTLEVFLVDQSTQLVNLQGQVPRSQYVMPNYPGNGPTLGWIDYPTKNFRSTTHSCGDTEPDPST